MRAIFFLLLVTSIGHALGQKRVNDNSATLRGNPEVINLIDAGPREGLPANSSFYVLPPMEFWYAQSWRDSVYLFSEFQEGRFVLDTGFSPEMHLMMNYNIFFETIDMRDEKGIGILKKFPEIKFTWIGDHKFYYNSQFGYLEIILDGKISVGRKIVMASLAEMSNGARYQMIGADARTRTANYTRYYWPIEYYYILDPDYRTYRAGSLTLLSILPGMKDRIKDFVAVNNINYREKEDILKIVTYCNENLAGPISTIPADTDLKHSAWRDSLYMFPSFQEASLTLADGTKLAPLTVNLNYLTGWFDTIGKKGDTVALSTERRVHAVIVDGITFINDNSHGAIEVILHGKVSLGSKKKIEYNRAEKFYQILRSCFFIHNNKVYKANVKNLLAAFPRHKKAIMKYLSANNPNFESKADMIELLTYCSQL